MIISLGKVSTGTHGANFHKRYELVAVDPWCEDTAPIINGQKVYANCMA